MTDETPRNKTEKSKMRMCAYHYVAIEMRYAGRTYAEISLALTEQFKSGIRTKFSEGGLRRMFSRGGFLERPYEDFARKENERRRNLTLEELKKLAPLIPTTLKKLLDRKLIYLDKKTGEIVQTGQDMLDKTTLATIQTIARMMGFQVNAGEGGSDPADRFFEEMEDQTNVEKDRTGTDQGSS